MTVGLADKLWRCF